MKTILKILLLFMIAPHAHSVPQNILFIGNSYFYYNDSLHNHVRRMLGEAYPEMTFTFKSSTISAARLHHHNFDHLIDHKNLGVKEKYDLIIMQAGSFEFSNSEFRKKYIETVKEFSSKAKNSDIKTALYMFHDYLPHERRYRENNLKEVIATHRQAAKETDSLLLPIALAFEKAYAKRGDIKLHHPDGSHPALLGHYLAAYTIFAYLTNSSPVGLKYNYLNQLSDEDILFLQTIAWETYIEQNN
ncbi:MAG: hypothetical protein O3B35_00795 [Proteobacteria bacterium]|nr:hypothetical protein [Pseudomonadota bacterium]